VAENIFVAMADVILMNNTAAEPPVLTQAEPLLEMYGYASVEHLHLRSGYVLSAKPNNVV
jgi:hypothetical protein